MKIGIRSQIAPLLLIITLCLTSVRAQSSWTTPVPIDPSATQFQSAPLIAVSPQRQIAIACSEGASRVVVYRSTNNGATFLRSQLPQPPVAEFEIREIESLGFDDDDNLYLL